MKPGWTKVTLGDVCQFKYGKALAATVRKPGRVPVFGSNGQVGLHDQSLTDGPAVIVGRKGSFGEINFSKVPSWPIDTTYYIDQAATKQDLGWLRHVLPILRLTELNRAAAVPGLNREDAYRRELLLPPIEEQRRIAAILDHAQSLRALAAARLSLLDSMVDSRFRHDFGNPGPDSKGARPLREVVRSIENGRSPVCESRPRSDGEYGILKLGAVTYGVYRPAENKAFLGAVLPNDREVRAGDILMTRKNTKDLVGALVYVEETPDLLLLPDLVFRLNYDDAQVHPVFLQRLLMSRKMRDAVRSLASGSAASMSNISKARLLELPVPIPSMSRQLIFVRAAAAMGRQRARAYESNLELTGLCEALRARAFSGRL